MDESNATNTNVTEGGADNTQEVDSNQFEQNFWEGGEDSSKKPESPDLPEKETQAEEPKENAEAGSSNTEELLSADERQAELGRVTQQIVAGRGQLQENVAGYEGMQALAKEINDAYVTPEELIQAGMDEQEAQIQALLHNQSIDRQANELKETQADIADLQYNLSIDRVELMRNYPVFDDKSPEYDEAFMQKAMDMYMRDAGVQLGEDGMPVSARIRLYDYMSDLAEIRAAGIKAGSEQVAQKQAKLKQSAAVMSAGGNAAAESDADEENKFINNFFN